MSAAVWRCKRRVGFRSHAVVEADALGAIDPKRHKACSDQRHLVHACLATDRVSFAPRIEDLHFTMHLPFDEVGRPRWGQWLFRPKTKLKSSVLGLDR